MGSSEDERRELERHCIEPIKSLDTTILDGDPSCIEFSRVDPKYCVVGTYRLVGELAYTRGQSRDGSLLLMEWTGQKMRLAWYCTMASAVLDLHFSPHQPEMLAVATADGSVHIYSLHLQSTPFLVLHKQVPVCESFILSLSIAWHPSREKSTTLAASFSSGNIAVIDWKKTPACNKLLGAHSLEAWTVAWASGEDAADPDNFYLHSGGDDSILSSFSADELRSDTVISEANAELEVEIEAHKPKQNTKLHSAGVTAILPLDHYRAHQAQILLTGSYDEHIRVLVRTVPTGMWKSVTEERILGGGVWRLKLLSISAGLTAPGEPYECYTVLASCMHAGARILEVRISKAEKFSVHILAKFTEHESMNYATDATILGETTKDDRKVLLVVSTSFYDRKLCVWRYEVGNAKCPSFQIGPISPL